MVHNFREIIYLCWLAVGAVWLLTAFRLKPVVATPRSGTRAWEILALLCAAQLLFSQRPHWAMLDARYLPVLAAPVAVGIALTAAGAAFAIAARLWLGRNWSASATFKEGHELVRSGPYRLVRHPIYTGGVVGALGTALAFGEVRDLLALPLIVLGFWLKARSEEELLMKGFGERYGAYRRAVRGAIIPFWF